MILKRLTVFAASAGLAVLAGCGTSPPGSAGPSATSSQPGSAPAPSVTQPSPVTRPPSGACPAAGAYLTAVRVGQQAGSDRVVFEFSGGLPAYDVTAVTTVYADPKGDAVPLAGQAYLRIVFRGASAWCEQPARQVYTGPSVLTPFYPQLLVVSAAGDFERVLSFGVGLAAKESYRVYALSGPDRVVLDLSRPVLGTFPGIWDITSWQQYWERQYSWNNGHQPWLASPAMVVAAWARSRWDPAPVPRQVAPNTFQVTEPGGRVDTVTGSQPVTVPGPWVITGIAYGTSPA